MRYYIFVLLAIAAPAYPQTPVPRPQPIGYAPSPTATTVSVKWFNYAVYLETVIASAPIGTPPPQPSLQTIADKIDALANRPFVAVSIRNSTVVLTATATGTEPITLTWFRDGTQAGTGPTLTVQSGSAASYYVVASNVAGNATSQTIAVTAP